MSICSLTIETTDTTSPRHSNGSIATSLNWCSLMNPLPVFAYHPDPIATGSVASSDRVCVCCGQARGYVYVGPVYAVEEYAGELCPWCIAEGSAHQKLGASFTDEAGIGGYGDWDKVSEQVIETVACRTPGFSGWQQEQWWTHCNDAAQFIGCAGRAELEALGPEASEAIRRNTGLSDSEWERFLRALKKDGSPTAYMFRCRSCGALGGYQDSD